MIFLAVVSAYDTLGASAETLYFSSNGFKSRPTDTPPNQYFEPRIKQAASMRRDAFSPGRTFGRSTVGMGDLVLKNSEDASGVGALDYLLNYAFDGRVIEVYVGADTAVAFPGDFEPLVVSTMEQAEFTRSEVRLKLRDRQLELDVPLQTTLYDGDNALPAGLEGVEDLKGKPKPKCFGKVRNISPPCVNTSKLIYQANDGEVFDIRVFDTGVPLGLSEFTQVVGHGFGGVVAGICYSPEEGQFVAVAGAGDIGTSPDGLTWTQRVSNVANNLYDVAFGDGTWVAVGAAGDCTISSDGGVTWTEKDDQFGASGILCVAYGAGRWVIGTLGKAAYSTDGGLTWTLSAEAPNVWELIYVQSLGLFVGVGGAAGTISTSPDGETWTGRLAGGGLLKGIAQGPAYGGRMQLVAVSDSAAYRSVDAVNWTAGPDLGTPQNVVYGLGRYFVVAQAADPLWISTADAATWIEVPNPHGDIIQDIAIGSDGSYQCIVTVGEGAEIYRATAQPVATYATEADLLDDSLAPTAGSYGVYLAGGYFRLGSPANGLVTADVIQGAAATDRTAAKGLEWALGAAGKANLGNLMTSDDIDADWTSVGTPVVTTGVADPWGGTDAYTIADDNAAAAEGKWREVTFVGDGTKSVAWVVKEATMPAAGVQRLALWDDISGVNRLALDISAWVAGEPTVTASVGTLVRSFRVRPGWWCLLGAAPSVDASHTNVAIIYPAVTVAQTGSITVYKARVFNSADPEANDWSWLDVLHLDHDNDAVCGFWSGLEPITCAEVASKFAESVGAWWGVDRRGAFRSAIFGDPTGETATVELTANDMKKPLERISTADPGHGIPIWRSIIRFSRNYTPQSSDLAAGVSDARRGLLAREWKEESDEDATVQTAHILAGEQVDETLLAESADAAAEATRRLALRDGRRDPIEFAVPLTMDTVLVDFDDFVEITHSRFGLTAGKVFAPITIEPDAAARLVTLRLWG